MAERVVAVRLRAMNEAYDQAMAKSRQATERFARDAGINLDRLGDVAAGAGRTFARGFAATAAAGVGLAASLARVGTSYNALEAQSRVAMATMLGDAQRASALMDELFEFTSTSPFAREVFITATRQLVGFGMEAERILPTLRAIQDQMAAVGGSNQDIAEIVDILAQITSTGKITAVELRRFGLRGVDAAGLIAQAFGTTAAEIREQISAGAIDADDAVAAMVASINENVGGAAESVKQMWDGAQQAISARWRNLGSDLMEPFVSKSGGGAAVDWLNEIGDMLSALRTSAVPALVPRLEAAADAADRAMASISSMVRGLDAAQVDRFLDRVAPIAPVLAAGSAAMMSFGTNSIKFLPTLNPWVAGFAALAATSPELRSALIDLALALGDLAVALAPAAESLAEITTLVVAHGLAPAVGVLADAFGVLAGVLGEIPGLTTAVVVAIAGLKVVSVVSGAISGASSAIDTLRLRSMYAREGVGRLATSLGPAGMAGAAGFAAVAVGAVAYNMHLSRQRAEEARARIKAYADAIAEAGDAAEGASNRIAEMLRDAPDIARFFDAAGVSVDDFTEAALGSDRAWERMQRRLLDAAEAAGWSGTKLDYLREVLDRTRGEVLQGADDVEILDRVLGETGDTADGAVDPMDAYAAALDEVGGAAEDTTSDLEALNDALKALFDPVFAFEKANRDFADAQAAVTDAIKEHGAASTEAAEAEWDLLRATVDLESAANDLVDAVDSGAVSWEDAERTLRNWEESGRFTGDTADRLIERLQLLALWSDEVNGREINMHLILDTSAAQGAVDAINEAIAGTGRSFGSMMRNIGRPVASVPAQARAMGGPVVAGMPYLVNERTPHSEIFVPAQSGAIFTPQQFQQMISGSSGGAARVENHYHLDRALSAGEVERLGDYLARRSGWDIAMAGMR